MRTLAILNPNAGNGKALRVWERVRASVDGVKVWECVMTERPTQARELAREASDHGYERVVALGGDGTICEVVNGLVHTETTLAIIPIGTANDTANNLDVPGNPLGAAALAVTGTPRSIDVGRVETMQTSTYYLNIAGFGFDAEVSWRTSRIPKFIGGTLPYVAGVLQTLATYRSPQMRLVIDGKEHEGRVFMAAVANMSSYGGGMRIAPHATPDDGLFDVCLVDDVSRIEVLRLVPRMYSGGHAAHPAVTLLRARTLIAEANERVRCHADGELVGSLPAHFSILAGALRCVTGP